MKLLFDQNISFRILNSLPVEFNESSHISNEKLKDADDFSIWKYAKENQFTIVTKDADFNDLMNLYGFPPKILWLRGGNQSTLDISRTFFDNSQEILAFEKNNSLGCLIITKV